MISLPFTVGLTGGIGSGKSAASHWFGEQGIHIVDADVIARHITTPGSTALVHIAQTFGTHLILADGSLDRSTLRHIVFADSDARQQLERITHPLIHQQIITNLAQATSPYCLLVSPLLLEGSQRQLVQRILVIDVPELMQIERAAARDHNTPEQISAILAAQLPRHARLAQADDIVDNSHDLSHLYQALKPLHQQYLALAGS